ncbi:unnamed protein product [Peniophora sp. CBMAI 1063]|nr:unnamed protein product [Peniophora sp. CBMAI 1063]
MSNATPGYGVTDAADSSQDHEVANAESAAGQTTVVDSNDTQHRLAVEMYRSYSTTGKLEYLVKAVKVMHELVGAGVESTNGEHLSDFGGMLLTLHVRLGKLPHLELAIIALARAVDLTADHHPDKPGRLSNLGACLQYRFQQLGELDDLENSIAAHRRGIELTPAPTLRAGQLTNLGSSLTKLFEHNGALDTLDEAISVHRRAVDLTWKGHPEQASHLNNLGIALYSRFERVADLRDLEASISTHRRATEVVPRTSPYRATFLNNLCTSLVARYELVGDLTDIDGAIAAAKGALEITPDGDPDKAAYLKDLSACLLRRFGRTGALDDLEDSISTARSATDLVPDDHPKKPAYFNSLGAALMARFEHAGEPSDLEAAISALQHAVELSPDGHVDKPNRLSNLGNALQKRFKRFGAIEDIDAAVTALRSAADLTPDDDADKPGQLNNLAIGFQTRFNRLDGLNDLNDAVATHHRSLELTPNGSPAKPGRFHNLGVTLQSRYDRLGDMDDLNKAIAAKQEALQLLVGELPGKPSLLHSFGNSLQCRFERLGDMDDLDRAISAHLRAVEATPDARPLKPSFLNSLGGALLSRFERTGESEMLSSAISARAQAVKLTPDGHPDMSLRLNSFGITLQALYENTGDLEDLDKVITVKRQAVELTPDDHPDKPHRLNNLGNSLQRRFAHAGELSDLEAAISTARLAVQLIPDGHRDKLEILFNLGCSLELMFGRDKDRDSFNAAIDCLLAATRQPLGNPYHRVSAANKCVGMFAEHPDFSRVDAILEAHSCVLDTLPGIVWLGHDVSRRYEESARLGGLASAAVAAAIEAGALSKAVEWLEAGRSLVWSQIMSLRAPLEEVEKSYPDLAQSLRAIQQELQQSGFVSDVPTHVSPVAKGGLDGFSYLASNTDGDRHRALAVEYERLLTEVRACPGFEDFLRPKKLSALLADPASIANPFVFINVHSTRCDALILLAGGGLILVPLPALSLERAQKLRTLCTASLEKKAMRERGSVAQDMVEYQKSNPFMRLAELMWHWIVEPILKSIDLSVTTIGTLPRIIWCPTGPLTQLPLHAAGVYDKPSGPRAFDIIVSSYTPSLSAYMRCKSDIQKRERRDPSVLIVTQPSTARFAPLPGTRAESRRLLEVLGRRQVSNTLLDHDQATVSAVKSAINSHSWVHLACHGSQDQDDPTKSAFALFDGPLSLSTLMRTEADHVELAFLSACQTATGDDDNLEESAHLAAGMLAVGFKGVIATMWSIGDDEAPIVVGAYYSRLLELRGPGAISGGNTGAAYALHEAVKGLREVVGETDLAKWAPFVHLGA